jgi:hypothetical protein
MKKKNKWFSVLSVLAVVFLSFVLFTACGDRKSGGPGSGGPTEREFVGVTADGTANAATTAKLTLTFSDVVDGLAVGDITLSAGATGAAKGALTAAGTTGVYELTLTGITQAGEITVVVDKDGYAFEPSSKKVTIHYSSANPGAPAAPVITAQPQEASYTAGDTASALSVIVTPLADGAGTLSYQWYSSADNNTAGGTAISNATSASYTPSAANTGTTYYYVIVTNTKDGQTSTTTSSAAKIAVTAVGAPIAPVITAQPEEASYTVGATASALSVTVTPLTDGGTLSYQWYSNAANSTSGGTAIDSATAASYTPPVTSAGTTYYYVIVTNTKDGQTETTASTAVKIEVTAAGAPAAPVITAQPQEASYTAGAATVAALSVTVTPLTDGGTLSYQWYSNTANSASGGTAISNATGASYTPSAASAGTTYYYVIVTNTKDGQTNTTASSTAKIEVTTGGGPTASFTVWFNTNFAVPSTISPALNVGSGSKITAPASSLSKDGFTFKGWYTKYSVDSATGLWKYEDADKWNFDTNTVTKNMTLYAGWDGGIKRMPRSWIWADQANHLQGRLIELQAGKTYKLGTRYFVQPGFGPVYLQARYRPNNENYTTQKSITLQNAANDDCFTIAEDEFTAAHDGWYFIGLSHYNPSGSNNGQYILHEVWLKEKGGGDINLLTDGDFIWKDIGDMANTGKFHQVTYNGQDPFHEGGAPRNEWDPTAWNMNSTDVHMAASWTWFVGSGGFLGELTDGKISNGQPQKLVFPMPEHP